MPRRPVSIGPYRILGPLGEGGMGVVYRARHGDSGESVALKTVRVPHAGMLGSIRREIHALSRIRHPGIVTFVDAGVEDGTPWYAMEILEGESLRALIRRHGRSESTRVDRPTDRTGVPNETTALSHSPTVVTPERPSDDQGPGPAPPAGLSMPIQWVLDLARQICAPLAYLHGEGLVHRDLKPDNIVVRPDGTPVVVDFGVMSQFGGQVARDALEVAGLAAGTWAYMAPEQARGDRVDARADLYSLGCILYELLTGNPPFGFQGGSRIVRAHAEEPPASLVEVPRGLAELVMRLLAKEPNRRIGYAVDVASRLSDLGASAGMAGPPARPYLYRPVLSGRSAPMARVAESLEALRRGRGGHRLVAGESGVGKTRLLAEVGSLARRRGVEVLAGGCEELRPAPLGAFVEPLQALADHCREKGVAAANRIFGPRGRVLSVIEPSLAGLPGQDVYPDPDELPLREARIRLFTSLQESLAARAGERKLLVLLDDLQWADELTLAFLEFATTRRRVVEEPILVVGAYRPEEATDRLSRLAGMLGGSDTLVLGRLDEAAVGIIVQEMLALDAPPPVLTEFLEESSEGVPFFVAEYLRLAVAEGLLYRNAAGVWSVGRDVVGVQTYRDLPLPRSVHEVVERRIQSLEPAPNAVLEAASVLGRETTVRLLGAVACPGESEPWSELEDLRSRQVVEIDGDRVRITHARIREVAYRGVESDRRQELHRAAARAIDEHAEGREAEIGRHWEEAGEPVRARSAYLAAARRAVTGYLHDEAERLYRRYLDLADPGSVEELQVRLELAREVLQLRGRMEEAEVEVRSVLVQSHRDGCGDLTALARNSLGWLLGHTGRAGEARRELEEAITAFRESGDRANEAMALMTLADVDRQQGRLDDAADLQRQSAEIFRTLDDASNEAVALGGLAGVYQLQGRIDEAREIQEAALAIHQSLGNREAEGRALGNLALVLQNQGRMEEALALHERALQVFRETGNRTNEGIALDSIAFIRQLQGQMDEARSLHEQSLQIFRETGSRYDEGIVLVSLGNIRRVSNEPEEARALFEEALSINRELEHPHEEGRTLGYLALLHRELGEPGPALALLEQALEIFRRLGTRTNESIGLVVQARLLSELGRLEEAWTRSEEAVAAARELQDPRVEGAALSGQAGLQLFLSDDGALVESRVEAAERCLLEAGDPAELVGLGCVRGHLALSQGGDAAEQLVRIDAAEDDVRGGIGQDVASMVDALRRAQECLETGGRLVCGYAPRDVTDGQLDWLATHRPEALEGVTRS